MQLGYIVTYPPRNANVVTKVKNRSKHPKDGAGVRDRVLSSPIILRLLPSSHSPRKFHLWDTDLHCSVILKALLSLALQTRDTRGGSSAQIPDI